jgi:hypothetical protein
MLKRCVDMMSRQTLQPEEVFIMNDPPEDPGKKDITWRYRKGLQRIAERHPNTELVLLIEDDDWYSPSYIEVFYRAWNDAGRPEIFGVGETRYYHIGMKKLYHEVHQDRASAFSTGITLQGAEKMKWPNDDFSFVDLYMWRQLEGKTFVVDPPVCLGIKGHKEGTLFGGSGHNDKWWDHSQSDRDLFWARRVLDQESFTFYFNNNHGPMGVSDPLGPNKKTQGTEE